MGTETNISWTDRTWNPVIGCSKVSPGCANCYAEQLSKSPKMLPFGYTGLPWIPANAHLNVQLKPQRLEQPLHWRKPCRVFVNSMSDLFHELVPDDFILSIFKVMAACPQHTFQILTKRPDRMKTFLNTLYADGDFTDELGNLVTAPIPNVWLGTSVENQHWADVRIPLLRETSAAVRFLSCEPLLGRVDLKLASQVVGEADGVLRAQKLHWVITGGESGPRRRRMDLDWARDLRDQCLATGVSFFYKQSGGARSETGKELDGQRWEQMPEVAA